MRFTSMAITGAAALTGAAAAQPCIPGWHSTQGGMNSSIYALVVYEEHGRPTLFAGGSFGLAGGLPTGTIARWDGIAWSAVGDAAFDRNVRAMTVFDDGSGPALYVGGSTLRMAAAPADTGIFRWDGTAWSWVGDALLGEVGSLAGHDDGTGPALYAGGGFWSELYGWGGPRNLMKLTGTRWEHSWSGTGAEVLFGGGGGAANALLAHNDGSGPALFAGGGFNTHQPTRYMVRYTTCNHPGPCYPNCDGSTLEPALNVDDFTCFISEFAAGRLLPHAQQVEHYANCDGSGVAPVLNVDDFSCFINAYAAGCP